MDGEKNEGPYRCFVSGLDWSTSQESLRDAFSPFGVVVESKIINDRETGRSRGFGFVSFNNEQSMRDAVDQMNGRQLDGRTITVNAAQSRGGYSSIRIPGSDPRIRRYSPRALPRRWNQQPGLRWG